MVYGLKPAMKPSPQSLTAREDENLKMHKKEENKDAQIFLSRLSIVKKYKD